MNSYTPLKPLDRYSQLSLVCRRVARALIAVDICWLRRWTMYESATADRSMQAVIFLHGGIGDVVMALEGIYRVDLPLDTIILLPEKFKFLSVLIPDRTIKLYKKNSLTRILKLSEEIPKNSVGISLNPIFEVYFFYRLLGITQIFGLLNTYNAIGSTFSREVNKSLCEISIISRNQMVLSEFKTLLPMFARGSPNRNKPHFKTVGAYYAGARRRGHVCLSFTKTVNWQMGRFEVEFYKAIVRFILNKTNLDIVLTGVQSEADQLYDLDQMFADEDRVRNLIGQTSFPQLLGILDSSFANVCNDNGTSHLSRYLEKRTLVLFNFSDPERYKWGVDNEYVHYYKKYDCMPCVGEFLNVPIDNYSFKCPYGAPCSNSFELDSSFDTLLARLFNLDQSLTQETH